MFKETWEIFPLTKHLICTSKQSLDEYVCVSSNMICYNCNRNFQILFFHFLYCVFKAVHQEPLEMADTTEAPRVVKFQDVRPSPDPIHEYTASLKNIPIVIDNGKCCELLHC